MMVNNPGIKERFKELFKDVPKKKIRKLPSVYLTAYVFLVNIVYPHKSIYIYIYIGDTVTRKDDDEEKRQID